MLGSGRAPVLHPVELRLSEDLPSRQAVSCCLRTSVDNVLRLRDLRLNNIQKVAQPPQPSPNAAIRRLFRARRLKEDEGAFGDQHLEDAGRRSGALG